jgi:hypothetical protein
VTAVTPGQAPSHIAVESPNKPRPDDRLLRAVADTLRRIEANYDREGSGPGSRFEGELLEDIQARTAVAMVRAQQAEAAAVAAQQQQPAPELTHTREDVIASYNAGYAAAAEKHAQPAPELPDCLAPHCPPSMHTDCEWPKCARDIEREDI